MALHHWKALYLRIVLRQLKIIFIKGLVSKLHIKLSAFYGHFPLKVQGSFKVLSLACSVRLKYCIFANIFCKHRQLHPKMQISVCPIKFFQRMQHHWTNTLKEQRSHLNSTQIWACKNLSKAVAHVQIRTGTNFLHILLWEYVAYVAWQNLRKL